MTGIVSGSSSSSGQEARISSPLTRRFYHGGISSTHQASKAAGLLYATETQSAVIFPMSNLLEGRSSCSETELQGFQWSEGPTTRSFHSALALSPANTFQVMVISLSLGASNRTQALPNIKQVHLTESHLQMFFLNLTLK